MLWKRKAIAVQRAADSYREEECDEEDTDGSPGSFDVAAEKITILEALGHAGDLTSYSERSKVKIIRDINGNREIISLDLTDKAALNSVDFYINRYDIIYVTAKKVKETNENLQRITPYIGLIASLLAIIALIKN